MTDKTTNDATPSTDTGSGDLFNTAAGWVLFAAGLGLGLSILAGNYFHGDKPKRPDTLGYVIEGVEEEAGAVEMTMAEALTLVTAADGERVFAKCAACHTIEQGGANGVGPNLYGSMGGAIGGVSGYEYSGAVASFGGQWGWDEMNDWLNSPRGYIADTKMGFNGLSKIEDRAAVALYMNENGSSLPLPAFTPAEEVVEEEGEALADQEAEAETDQNDAEATSEETAAAEASE